MSTLFEVAVEDKSQEVPRPLVDLLCSAYRLSGFFSMDCSASYRWQI